MNTKEFESLLTIAINKFQEDAGKVWQNRNPGKPLVASFLPRSEVNWNFYFAGNDSFKVKDIILTLVEEVGGEDEGSYKHLIFRVEHVNRPGLTQWFKKTGYYSSYEGTDWEEGSISEVTPQERTVIVYE